MNEVPFAPLCILIVDDNVDAANSLAILAGAWGYRALVAHDGETALSLADSYSPDVVILDIGLPRMTGWDVARILRQSPATASAYLMVLSCYGQELDKVCSLAAGCNLHMVKPVPAKILRDILNERQLEKENREALV